MIPSQKTQLFILHGQVRGGKNNLCHTRTGRTYPNPKFVLWRHGSVTELLKQKPAGWKPITVPVIVELTYTPEDNRRRDLPAIIDALWHVLGSGNYCAGIVSDDNLLGKHNFYFEGNTPDKQNAGVEILLTWEG